MTGLLFCLQRGYHVVGGSATGVSTLVWAYHCQTCGVEVRKP